MCGIAGCVGIEHAPELVLGTLQRQEERGYDSAGIAWFENEQLHVVREVGRIANLRDAMPENIISKVALGHNRWATHGRVTKENAHPHQNTVGTIAAVQNGTVDNYLDLRSILQGRGYTFRSETDTEVIPHLLDFYTHEGAEPEEAFKKTLLDIEGAYAILAAFTSKPDTLYAARLGSPLIIGHNQGIGRMIASSANTLAGKSKYTITLGDGEMATLTANDCKIQDIKSGIARDYVSDLLGDDYVEAVRDGYDTFMLKEIYESPDTVRAALSGRVLGETNEIRLGGLTEVSERLKSINKIVIVGCGTSEHAGMIGERLFEELTGIDTEIQDASEFQYHTGPLDHNTAVIAISQSGETADTIGALRAVKDNNVLRLGIVNNAGSQLENETDAGVHCRAGAEVAVASTKAFTSQVTILAEMALAMSPEDSPLRKEIMSELVKIPEKIERVLKLSQHIKEIAEKHYQAENALYIGRGYERFTAYEGALKLTEISYISAQGLGAGSMKHGPIALIDEDFPVVVIATQGKHYTRTLSNASELRARGAAIIAVASEGDQVIAEQADDIIYIPKTAEQLQPILNNVALQLFAYHTAQARGLNIDQPRNLAKSVTVE